MNIKIDCNSLRYGMYIGFKLARLEFLWDSKFEFAQKEFLSSKDEILSHLPITEMNISESSFQAFSQSILGYYFRENINVHYSILIGIAMQRYCLVGVLDNDLHNKEMSELAESALNSIPQRVISDKAIFSEILINNKEKDFYGVLEALECFCTDYDMKRDSQQEDVKTTKKPTLFLSYTQKDTPIADIIEECLRKRTNDGIEISRYTSLPYKASFKLFMNSIQEHDYVLCIVSGTYLKSKACMYEVGEIVKDHNFQKKLLFVVLSEIDIKYYAEKKEDFSAANIYGDVMNRLKYIAFWKDKYKELDEELKKIGSIEAIRFLANELYEIEKICKNDISTFLEYLVQNNGKTFDELYLTDFDDIVNWINPGWQLKLFKECKSFSQVLSTGIREICRITGTDYNQIALGARISRHENGLVVFAENIPIHKQNYRLVIMEGVMGRVFSTGNCMNIENTDDEAKYFCAVAETKSELVVPIMFQGQIIGVINSEAEEYKHYSKEIEYKMVKLANDLAVALARVGFVPNMEKEKIPHIHV